jgi:hypothetical protein
MDIVYNATATAKEFHKDPSFVKILRGPVGTGKSVSSLISIWAYAKQQQPGYDGIRRTRWAVIRNTYPDLKTTTIKTWLTWFPEEYFGKIKWDSPIVHRIRLDDIDCEVFFMPLDEPDSIKKLMSLELTGVYINEAQFIERGVFEIAQQRVDRYPPAIYGAPITWTGVLMDTNPPSTRHWIYEIFEKSKPQGFKMFSYEPALIKVDQVPNDGGHAISLDGTIYINNPNADYRWVQNNPDYWLKLVWGYTDDQINVYLLGNYGYVKNGKPVYPEYNDKLHHTERVLKYNPQVELGLGFDFGLTPACAIVQLTPRGQFQVIDEVWSEDMGLRQFLEDMLIPHLSRHYPGWKDNYVSRHDPSGGSGVQTDKKTCEDILKEFGIKSVGAHTNDPTARRDAVKYFLGRMTDGEPGIMVSSKCEMIRAGFQGEFKYPRIMGGEGERYHEKPLKNIYSHIMEGCEYIAMNYARVTKKPENTGKKAYNIHHGSFMSM